MTTGKLSSPLEKMRRFFLGWWSLGLTIIFAIILLATNIAAAARRNPTGTNTSTSGLSAAYVGLITPKDIVPLLAAAIAGFYAARLNRKNKIADVVMQCSLRYDNLLNERAKVEERHVLLMRLLKNNMTFAEDGSPLYEEIASKTALESAANIDSVNPDQERQRAQAYFRRYWGLLSDEFDYWMMGLLDPESIASWFNDVLFSFEKCKEDKSYPFITLNYDTSWRDVSLTQTVLNPQFCHVVEQIRRLALIESGENHPLNKYWEVLDILIQAESDEFDYIRFSDVKFVGLSFRSRNMAHYKKMEMKRPIRATRLQV